MRSTLLVVALAASLAACASGPGGQEGTVGPTGVDPRFVSFRLGTLAGPCPPGAACGTSIAFDAAGQLTGAQGHVLSRAQVSPADLAAAVRVVTAPSFVALLDAPPCQQSRTDMFESMELDYDGRQRADPASACRTEAPVEAVRAEMQRLAGKYFR